MSPDTTTVAERPLDDIAGPQPRYRSELFDDVSSSESAVSGVFHPHSIAVTRREADFQGLLSAVEIGPFVMGELDYNVSLALDCPQLFGYHLNMPVRGALVSLNAKNEVYAVPGTAVVYRTATAASVRTVSDTTFHMFALKIDARALENTMTGLLGRPPEREPIRFAASLDLSRGHGLHWWNLLSSIRTQGADNPLLHNPLVAAPLCQSLLTGLLLAAGHQHSERLSAPSAAAMPATLRLATDLIEARLDEPLTVVDVARGVGLSTRALQRGFVSHIGTTPSRYIRSKRLDRAHADLAASEPSETRVSDVAQRWGFTHPGRFAHDYQARFGIAPHLTLQA